MNQFIFIMGIIILLLGITITLGNIIIIYIYINNKKNISLVPFLGGILTFIGLILINNLSFKYIYLLPFILDIGCAYLTIASTIAIIKLNRKDKPIQSKKLN